MKTIRSFEGITRRWKEIFEEIVVKIELIMSLLQVTHFISIFVEFTMDIKKVSMYAFMG